MASSNTTEGEMEENRNSEESEEVAISCSSSSLTLETCYGTLPDYLQQCLMYCSILPDYHGIPKGKLIRLLVAQGLVQEKAGRIMEDVAEENLYELISLGMLQLKEHHSDSRGTRFQVSSPVREFCVCQMEEGKFKVFRVFICSDITQLISHLNNHQVSSLFLLGQNLSQHEGNWLQYNGANSLRVLDLERTKIKMLPDEVGDMINLLYLGLNHTDIEELPEGLGRLKALQTFDIRWSRHLTALPNDVLSLVRLRHLKMFKSMFQDVHGMKLPAGIGSLNDLLTLTGIHAGGGIAEDLGNLIRLRKLGVMDVAEENISELLASITKMSDLLSLSLEGKDTFSWGNLMTFCGGNLILPDSFSPPPFLQKLRLEGVGGKLPTWFGSLERLTNLRLGNSHISEDSLLVLQQLPNLENLSLWNAYDAKKIGKEFCCIGGFPKLQVLTIASRVLEEWIEIEEGALLSLKYLHVRNCLRLRILPEGLQFLTNLELLDLLPLSDDLAERLKPDGGEENYKIRRIPEVTIMTNSMVKEYAQAKREGSQCE
ncbi:disease resistance protein RPM1 [Pyrus x bretschneideri]|uniref:disease resistance protein RPM1 n=1 Tax=Pyrus x bretschneideri TaxID=225117 RepID=UPI00202E4E40|nr:disease resistance protein RPM1 [Pyrus x bretschneideri]